MNIQLEYKTLNDIYLFKIIDSKQRSRNKEVGEFYIIENPDCFVLQFKPYVDFFLINQSLDSKLDELFNNIFNFVNDNLDFTKPMVLLEDENIANRYAINHDLRKVPRYAGFYLYNC